MTYVTGSPMGLPDGAVTNAVAMIVWDHRRTPGCADTRKRPVLPPVPPLFTLLKARQAPRPIC